MNPFDLSGLAFLAFYALVSVAGLLFLYLVSHGHFSGSSRSPSGDARRLLRDPYLLAFLRGTVRETLQTVAFSLNKRRLLSCTTSKLTTTGSNEALKAVRNPLELAFLSQCASPQKITRLLRNKPLKLAIETYAEPLRTWGLIADDAELRRRRPAFIAVAGTLLALSAIELYVEIPREAPPCSIFLTMLAAIALIVAHVLFNRHRTNAGDRALADQLTLFAGVKSRVTRIASHRDTDEDVLVAAAFGLAALPAAAYPFAAQLRRHVEQSGAAGCGAGGSCGGGCGGGCGGC